MKFDRNSWWDPTFRGTTIRNFTVRQEALHQSVLLKFTYRCELSPDNHYFILYRYIMTPQETDVLQWTLIDVKKFALNSPIWSISEIRKIVISFVCRRVWFNLSKEKDSVRYSLLSQHVFLWIGWGFTIKGNYMSRYDDGALSSSHYDTTRSVCYFAKPVIGMHVCQIGRS